MEYAANRATLNYDTDAKGASILGRQRGTLIGQLEGEDPVVGFMARNAVAEPNWTEGAHGELGVMDPEPGCED